MNKLEQTRVGITFLDRLKEARTHRALPLNKKKAKAMIAELCDGDKNDKNRRIVTVSFMQTLHKIAA